MSEKQALTARAAAAYHRLLTGGVREAYDAYLAHLAGEQGDGEPAPLSHHTTHHLPAVMHIRSFYLADVTPAELDAWITWADVLTGRYHRELQPGDVATDMNTPAWRQPIAVRRDRKRTA
jgi:hypothetical protein